MAKFKVGDRVKCIKEPCDTSRRVKLLGNTGTVKTAPDRVGFTDVLWDGWEHGWRYEDGGSHWNVDNKCIELIEEKTVAKFKMGDKVRLLRDPYGKGRVGTIVTVIQDDGAASLPLQVRWSEDHAGFIWVEYADVEAITPEGLYIIITELDGKLAPATTPKTYKTHAQAKAVAAEMAERHGGKFLVFKSILAAEMPKQTKATFTEFN